MEDIEIRPAGVEDVPGVVACSAALFAEDAGQRDPTVDAEWAYTYGAGVFTAALGDTNRLLLVADADGAVVGHLSGGLGGPTRFRPVRIATVASLYVRPAYRGRGVGARLVDELRRWAHTHDVDRISLQAYASNAAAIRFYERIGFAIHSVIMEAGL